MRSKKALLLALVTLLVAMMLPAVASAETGLVNGGFEIGDFTGWQTVVPTGADAQVVTTQTHPSSGVPVAPIEGAYMASLKTDGAAVATQITQEFAAGTTISGFARFMTGDYSSNFNDTAWVKVNDEVVWTSSVTAVGAYGDSGWAFWSHDFVVDGTYTIEAGVQNVGDSIYDSRLLIDDVALQTVSLNAANPSPSGTVNQELQATVLGNDEMGLVLTEASLGPVNFGSVTLNGQMQTLVGSLGDLTVIDARGTLPGWSVTGRLATDFISDDHPTSPNGRIPASALYWVPQLTAASDPVVVAGAPGPLNVTTALMSAGAGHGGGTYGLDAQLELQVPPSVYADDYSAVLIVTIM